MNVPIGTDHLVHTDDTSHESEQFVVRNNPFVGLRGTGAAWSGFAGSNVSLLYDNVRRFGHGQVTARH